MIVTKTVLNGVYTITPELKEDERGYFTRTFCHNELSTVGIDFDIVQINQSLTLKRGTLRGMHFQKDPKGEKKIVQCLQGRVYDVVINIRKNSPEYGKSLSIELSEKNRTMIYIPEGFAHGFQALEDNSLLQYFMGEYYTPESAAGVAWNDPFFNISWPIENPLLSPKDTTWEFIKERK